MGKRARHTGSVEQRSKDSWRIRYWLPQDTEGNRRQATETVRGTKKDAEGLLRQRLAEVANGGYVPKDRQTVAEYMDYWMKSYAATNTTLRTQQGYRHYIRRHISPTLGGIQLQKLTGQHIHGFYASMLEKGLSALTVRHCHRIFKGALSRAVKWGVISRNPAESVTPPRPEKKDIETWDVDTFHRFLEAATDGPFRDIYHLAALTGMRRGELCGLKWDIVDLDAGYLRVTRTLQRIDGIGLYEGQPKTERSRRTISLSAGAVEVLMRVRAKQAEQRLKAGELWQDKGHVFTNEDGTPMSGERVSKDFARIVRAAGLPPLTFHGLRHTAASILIAGGVHARAIADILGHSSITVTMDTYGHLLNGVQQEAVSILDEQLSKHGQV